MSNPGDYKASTQRTRGGIQSVDVALTLLKVMAEFHGPASLSDIAARAKMPASKAHRYLASFVAANFVHQTERSGRYELSKAAIEIGLAAVGRLDFVERAAESLPALVEETGASAFVTVWGGHGPTTVRWQRVESFVTASIGLGYTFPLLTSATGRVFLAFSPHRLIAAKLKSERSEVRKLSFRYPDLNPLNQKTLNLLIERIRTAGYATTEGSFVPGLNGLAAPILNWQGEIEASITLAAADPRILDPKGNANRLLLQACRNAALQTTLQRSR